MASACIGFVGLQAAFIGLKASIKRILKLGSRFCQVQQTSAFERVDQRKTDSMHSAPQLYNDDGRPGGACSRHGIRRCPPSS